MRRFFLRYRLILWKHYLLWKRHPFITILLVLFPMFPVVCLAYLRGVVDVFETVHHKNSTIFPPSGLSFCDEFTILYSPDSLSASEIMNKIVSKLPKANITKCKDDDDMKIKLVALKDQVYHPNLFGVVFDDLPTNWSQTRDFHYKIRPAQHSWYTDELRPDSQHSGPMEVSDFYNERCFTNLQIALDESFIELTTRSVFKLEFLFQKFPYPPYVADPGLMALLTTYLSVAINFGFFILALSVIKKIVEEKNSGAKELMRMMGMSSEMQTLGWFTSYMILITVELIIMIIILACGVKGDPILKESCKFLAFVFLLLYSVSYLSLTIFLASIFNTEWKGTIALVLFSILPSYVKDAVTTRDVGLFPSMLLSLFPEIALQNGFGIIGLFESGGSGSQWSNLWTKPRGRDSELSLGIVFILLIVSSIIYLILAWYMDKVHPGKFGLARPWYFPFVGIYRKICDRSRKRHCSGENARLAESIGKVTEDADKVGRFEQLPPGKTVGIKIKCVKKYFESGHLFQGKAVKKAVDGVSLDILDGEITALLGHNGAGKTTLINILTGLYSATEGNIIMGGYDIERNIDNIRENLGLCPQHSLLFPELTVWEHLIFFAMSKGASYQIAQMESEDFLRMLNLEDKKYTIAKSLSGGMKRKLSVGIAFVGKSKILILDEPTTGMDPESRRQMWDLLLNLRRQRCILLTTHYMEEADVLGDRIAIMDHGQVKCHGTSLFLKKAFGTGYHLTILSGDPKNSSGKQEVTDLIKQKVQGATSQPAVGTELNFTLPTDEVESFPALFNELDNKKEIFGISGVSVSITTLEEVFLEVGKLDERKVRSDSREQLCDVDASQRLVSDGKKDKVTGCRLVMQQIQALFFKKLLYARTIWFQILIQSVFAIALLVTVLKSTEKNFSFDSEPPLTFSLSDYGKTYAFTYGTGRSGTVMEDIYKQLLLEKGSEVDKLPLDNITDSLLEAGEKNLAVYRESYVVSASFDDSVGTAYYSTTLRHSCPTSVNLMTTTLLRFLTNTSKSIVTTVHPFPDKKVGTIFDDIATAGSNLVYWLLFPHLGLMILLCVFVQLPIMEGINGARNLQLMALSPNISLFWIVYLLFDMAIYMANIFISVIIYLIISPGSYYRSDFYGSLILLLFLFGLCAIPFIYFISYFKDSVRGGVSSTSIVFMVGMILGIVVTVLELLTDLPHVYIPLHVIGLLLPSVPFTVGIKKFYATSAYNSKCDAIPLKFRQDLCSVLDKAVYSLDVSCCDNICEEIGHCFEPYSYFNFGNFTPNNETSFLGPEGMGVDYLCLAALVPFYLGILYLIDKGIFANILESILEMLTATFRKDFGKKVGTEFEDEDVCKEMDRMNFTLQSKQEGKDILKVHKLKKNYGWFRWLRGGHQAVRGVSFGVDPGDCFGLLGANGAGKTSTFQMITGTFPPSSGKSFILDEVSNNWRGKNTKYLAHVGYCPQFDGVLDVLTGRQMLSLYATLQGIPKEYVNKEVQNCLNNLDLNEPADRPCSAYSGGNLRRLGTAMALIGNQPLVCLDEPTAGVDPVARRGMWNVLKSAQSIGSALVLTSHSMEECEALCTKLAIMLNGQFVCIGEVPYLKHKFGQGFTLLVKLSMMTEPSENSASNVARLKADIETRFNPCKVKDEHQGLIHYQIMNPETKWGYMFSTMEELKRMHHPLVEDYSLSETTLEQVFISFAKQQESNE